jgi:hypothetical protein
MRSISFVVVVAVPMAVACGSSGGSGGAPSDGGGADTSSSSGSGAGSSSSVAPGSSSGASSGGSSSGGASSGGSSSGGASSGGSSSGHAGGAASTPFTALHTYYISPTGKDSNGGTSPADAWATPKHAVDCGDAIIALAGSYTNAQFGTNNWGTVSNCPSTTGGIDGQGGVYFAAVVCAGPDMTSCAVSNQTAEPVRVDASNWAVEGFSATQAAAAQGACYSATSETTATLHHIAFINDIASRCALGGFDSYAWTSPGGVDQTAVVGTIAYATTPSTNGQGLCGSGISLIPTNGPDTSAGAHVFVAGAFSYDNINAPSGAGCNTDGEGIIFDSWAIPQYKYTGIIEQSVLWGNGSAALLAFPQGNHTTDDQATVVWKHNTAYGNYQDPKNPGGGELFLNQVYPTTGSYTITDNLFEATESAPGGSGAGKVYGADIACDNGCASPSVSIAGNYIWDGHAPSSTAAGGENTTAYYGGASEGASWIWGSNTYGDPGFANPGALPATAPNCAGYANTTACMVGAGVVADLTPSGAAVGVGYEPPGSCAADPSYPTWLKGVVYLTVSGSSLFENPGLVTKPCGL